MSLFLFLTVVQSLVAAALVGVMSARGAANFLTRATAFLAIAFVSLSIILAALAVGATSTRKIDTSLKRNTTAADVAPSQAADPLAAPGGGAPAANPGAAPAAAGKAAPVDPLAPPSKK